VSTRAPALRSLALRGNPPGGTTTDILDVRYQFDVIRVDAPRDAAAVVAFESRCDWASNTLVDDTMGFPNVPFDLDVPVASVVSRADPLPTTRDGVGEDLGDERGAYVGERRSHGIASGVRLFAAIFSIRQYP
jgi:hypothetical protein